MLEVDQQPAPEIVKHELKEQSDDSPLTLSSASSAAASPIRLEVYPGAKIEMMRSNGIWVAAQVVRIGTKGMLLRYEVDNNVWEKVISLNSQSVAAFGTHVKPVAVAAREEKPKPKPKEKEKDEETESVVSRNSRSSRTSRQSNASRKNSKAKRESSRSRKSSKS